MKTVARIIAAHGGLAALKKDHIVIHNEPYMKLVIEHVGRGPGGNPAISVCHYYYQNGDSMQDPEMVFTVNPADDELSVKAGVSWKCGQWVPVMFQQAAPPVYQEVLQERDGKLYHNPKLMKDLASFARTWDRNIKHQKFLEAYLKAAGQPAPAPTPDDHDEEE